MADLKEDICANPGCTEPGTNKCSACKTTLYCGPICQTADWPHHREECPGHLRKVGMAHLERADKFYREQNYVQSLRYAEMALTKFKLLKDRSLATIIILDDALNTKHSSLNLMKRDKEALECATERYNMWATTNIRNPRTIEAPFPLIESLIYNKEFAQAQLIARTVHEMTMHPMTHDIPEDKQQPFVASAAFYVARATFELAQAGGILPEEKQAAGNEAIALARKALQIHQKLAGAFASAGVVAISGASALQVAFDMGALSQALECFNDDDNDDEPIFLFKQVIDIFSQVASAENVAIYTRNLGALYYKRACKPQTDKDLDRWLVNLEKAVPYFREAGRIYREINQVDSADQTAKSVTEIEEHIRFVRNLIATREAATASGRSCTFHSK